MTLRPCTHGWQLLYLPRGSIAPAVASTALATAVPVRAEWAMPASERVIENDLWDAPGGRPLSPPLLLRACRLQ